MSRIVLYPKDCIKQIKNYLLEQNWIIISEKNNFVIEYETTYELRKGEHFKALINWAVIFKTDTGFIHKMHFYFLDFFTDNIFKIGDIKSKKDKHGQMTTKVANFEYYNTTANTGFKNYTTKKGNKFNLSHNYHNLWKSLTKQDQANEISYMCILLKYHNHAGEWPRSRYYVNSFEIFMKSGLTKIQRFERNRDSVLDVE